MNLLYAYSITALKDGSVTLEAHNTAGALLAENEFEALGMAMTEAKNLYQKRDGYTNQAAVVFLVPEGFIRAITEIVEPPPPAPGTPKA